MAIRKTKYKQKTSSNEEKKQSFNPQKIEQEGPVNKSFAAVKSKQKEQGIPLKEIKKHKGESAIRFSMEEVKFLSEPFQFSLICKFSHGYPSIETIKTFLYNLGLQAEFSVGFIDKKHVLLRFFHEEDYLRIWLRNKWSILKCPMRVFKWTYNFKPGFEPSITPIWIRLLLLPVHIYNKSSIYSIASAFGEPLKLDTTTANLSRPHLARVCIQVDLSKELIHRIWIGYGDEVQEQGFWQLCLYEHLPEFCTHCKKIGHNKVECKVLDEMHQRDTSTSKPQKTAYFQKYDSKTQSKPRTQPLPSIPKNQDTPYYTHHSSKPSDIKQKWMQKRKKVAEKIPVLNKEQHSGLSFEEKAESQLNEHLGIKETLNPFKVLIDLEQQEGGTEISAGNNSVEIDSEVLYGHNELIEIEQDQSVQVQSVFSINSLDTQELQLDKIIEEKEEEFLSEQEKFVICQEQYLPQTETPLRIPPINICIRDPTTREILHLPSPTVAAPGC